MRALLETLCARILALPADRVARVGIDGVDGAGKTHLADELAASLRESARPVIRAGVDGFHQPAALRYQRGRHSPEGFFYDSYDYSRFKALLLDPLSPGGSGRYRRACFDHVTDTAVEMPEAIAPTDAILICDGIFLHRPELRAYWDFSIFLEVGFEVSIPRGAGRGTGDPDPLAVSNRRYIEGQQLYLKICKPQNYASLVIDNQDLEAPRLLKPLKV